MTTALCVRSRGQGEAIGLHYSQACYAALVVLQMMLLQLYSIICTASTTAVRQPCPPPSPLPLSHPLPQSSLVAGTFTPHSYCKTADCAYMYLQKPFGSAEINSYDYLVGWKTKGSFSAAWSSDLAILTLKSDMGSRTGVMGFSYDAAGYTGPVEAAGYPGETATFVSGQQPATALV